STYIATSYLYTLSLHDALPICPNVLVSALAALSLLIFRLLIFAVEALNLQAIARAIKSPTLITDIKLPFCISLFPFSKYPELERDRKSTRLNSSHVEISYAVFC